MLPPRLPSIQQTVFITSLLKVHDKVIQKLRTCTATYFILSSTWENVSLFNKKLGSYILIFFYLEYSAKQIIFGRIAKDLEKQSGYN